jgi:NAD dependent epimerase/dehydratase family enzyme
MTEIVNNVSPTPITNNDFMKTLQTIIGIPFGIPTSKFLLEIGSFFIRTEPELVLKSRNVIPRRLQENGFEFEYGKLDTAFQNILKK